MARVGVQLDPVPETLLWTLWHRAVEAKRRDRVLDDPLAVELVDRIDFPFVERFGDGELLPVAGASRPLFRQCDSTLPLELIPAAVVLGGTQVRRSRRSWLHVYLTDDRDAPECCRSRAEHGGAVPRRLGTAVQVGALVRPGGADRATPSQSSRATGRAAIQPWRRRTGRSSGARELEQLGQVGVRHADDRVGSAVVDRHPVGGASTRAAHGKTTLGTSPPARTAPAARGGSAFRARRRATARRGRAAPRPSSRRSRCTT